MAVSSNEMQGSSNMQIKMDLSLDEVSFSCQMVEDQIKTQCICI
jgi:hypothetical protein